MDIRKILQKINLIVKLEDENNLQGMFQDIFTHYQSNDPENLKIQKDSLKEIVEKSEINNFIQSDFNVLKGLGIQGYFDMDSINFLEKMLEAPGYQVQSRLENFINKRNKLLRHIRQLKSSLESLNIQEDKTQNVYHIVLVAPEKYRGLQEMERFLKDTKILLQEINSKIPEAAPPKIISVNNGSIELFIEVAQQLASYLYNIIDVMAKFYASIKAYENGKKAYESYKTKRKQKMDEIMQEELEENQNELLSNLLEQLPLSTPEDKNRAKKIIRAFIKHIEEGAYVELKTPILERPKDISKDDDEQVRKQKKVALDAFNKKQLIDKTNRKLFIAQKKGIRLELPKPTNDEDENDNN